MLFPTRVVQATWFMGQGRRAEADEIAALRHGLDRGLVAVDTAELYGDGAAERLVAKAIAGTRDDVFLISKVVPDRATAEGTVAACEASLDRLRTDRLDLYLIHWRGRMPLAETLEGFARLQSRGLIRRWGVGNFAVPDLAELVRTPGGEAVAADQVLFGLDHQGVEYDLLPWCLEHSLPVMAYAPLDRSRLLGHPVVLAVAARHDATAEQVAIAWLLDHENVVAVTDADTPERVDAAWDALDLHLDAVDLAELLEAFPPPLGPVPLEVA
jgi:diketogulonate reductase-like aldo/keto reductase